MSKFGYLKAADVSADQTQEFPIDEIRVNEKTPVLIVRTALSGNKAYRNEVLKDAARISRGGRVRVSGRMVEDNRARDQELYAKHIICGWRDVVDGEGNPVEYTAENGREFLEAIPDFVFDALRLFCNDPASFSDGDLNTSAEGND